jgi:hypothetical protein
LPEEAEGAWNLLRSIFLAKELVMSQFGMPADELIVRRFEGKNYWTQPQLEYIVTHKCFLIRDKEDGHITSIFLSDLLSASASKDWDITGRHWFIDVTCRKGTFSIECASGRQLQEYLALIQDLIRQHSNS